MKGGNRLGAGRGGATGGMYGHWWGKGSKIRGKGGREKIKRNKGTKKRTKIKQEMVIGEEE